MKKYYDGSWVNGYNIADGYTITTTDNTSTSSGIIFNEIDNNYYQMPPLVISGNNNVYTSPPSKEQLDKIKQFVMRQIEETEDQKKEDEWSSGFAEALQEVLFKIEQIENGEE